MHTVITALYQHEKMTILLFLQREVCNHLSERKPLKLHSAAAACYSQIALDRSNAVWDTSTLALISSTWLMLIQGGDYCMHFKLAHFTFRTSTFTHCLFNLGLFHFKNGKLIYKWSKTYQALALVFYWACGFQYWWIFMPFNSCFRPQLGCLQVGRRSETIKEDDTMWTTTAEPLHGQDPSFRYKLGFPTVMERKAKVYILTQFVQYESLIELFVQHLMLCFLLDRQPQRHHQHQHQAVQVYGGVPLHRNHLCPPRSLLSTPQALSPCLNLAPCRLVGRSAVLPVGDRFSLTTIQRRLPG